MKTKSSSRGLPKTIMMTMILNKNRKRRKRKIKGSVDDSYNEDDDEEDEEDVEEEEDDHERLEEVHEYGQYLGETCVPPKGPRGDYGRCCVEFVTDTNTIILVRVLIQYVGACRLMYHQRNYHGLFCRSGYILTRKTTYHDKSFTAISGAFRVKTAF